MFKLRNLKFLLVAALCAWALPASAANVYWSANVTAGGGASCTNGTYKWDADSGTANGAHKCWATATNGTTAAALPGSADTAVFDASSGSTQILVNAPNAASGAAMVNLQSMTTSGFAGGLDFSNGAATTNNVTLAATQSFAGSTAMPLNMGSGNWTLTGASAQFSISNVNVTCTCSSANIIFNGSGVTTGNKQFTNAITAGATFHNLTVSDSGGATGAVFSLNPATSTTFNDITLTGPLILSGVVGATVNLTGTLTVTGSAGNYVYIGVPAAINRFTWNWAGAPSTSITGAAITHQTFTCGSAGAITPSASFDLGGNTVTTCSLSISPPFSVQAHIIGG